MTSLHATIQQDIILTISGPDYEATLPPLSDTTWAKLVASSRSSRDECERLEFLGDALMYATIGRLLYAHISNGTPHLYTELRAALHSNATFSHIAEKLDILAVSSTVLHALTDRDFGEGAAASTSKSKPKIKATADLFETVIGAYYLEKGFEALCAWVQEIYEPLIKVARKAFYVFRTAPSHKRRGPDFDLNMRPAKKARCTQVSLPRTPLPLCPQSSTTQYRQSQVQATNQASDASRMAALPTKKRAKKEKAAALSRKAAPASSTKPAGRLMESPPRAFVIDLTLVSDSSNEEEGEIAEYPEIPRDTPAFSRGPSTVRPVTSKVASKAPFLVGSRKNDISVEEGMLEQMLTLLDPLSDMDLDSDPGR
ncbi:ribonuclease III [Laetiporus sulphureus 93-53]|uniref:Ribonuclease III n=1 Tax=Laetiporus sulphureus 93-53 TaxID=1314785 RepID=A0A165E0G1_9APHY|nr:ribonuclease III [Laetiporus sulphureus 93-53]KZT06008.1 ribonuclease III [Laetiporus sulphureus 93-53]